MKDLLVWSLGNARRQTLNLVKDLREDQMCLQSSAQENHPAWILGHLILGDTYLLSMLKAWELSDDFSVLLGKYGPNSKLTSNIENYDSKDFLVEKLKQTDLLRIEAIRKMDSLDQSMPDEILAQAQPTIGHHLQMLVFHEGHHCGGLVLWRKLQGLSAVKGIFAS